MSEVAEGERERRYGSRDGGTKEEKGLWRQRWRWQRAEIYKVKVGASKEVAGELYWLDEISLCMGIASLLNYNLFEMSE